MNKDIMKAMGFNDELNEIENNQCPFCHLSIKMDEFTDVLSLKEYRISGLCQQCQDAFFTKGEIE
jgi:hypothetical protein